MRVLNFLMLYILWELGNYIGIINLDVFKINFELISVDSLYNFIVDTDFLNVHRNILYKIYCLIKSYVGQYAQYDVLFKVLLKAMHKIIPQVVPSVFTKLYPHTCEFPDTHPCDDRDHVVWSYVIMLKIAIVHVFCLRRRKYCQKVRRYTLMIIKYFSIAGSFYYPRALYDVITSYKMSKSELNVLNQFGHGFFILVGFGQIMVVFKLWKWKSRNYAILIAVLFYFYATITPIKY